MLGGVARRLKRGIDDGLQPGRGLLPTCQDHVIAAARAHVERLVLEAFVDKAVDRCPDGDTKVAARPAVRPVRPDARSRPTGPGSWSTAGSPRRAPRRSAARSTTCAARSGRWRVDLVDAFGVPREMLRVPSLRSWRRCMQAPRAGWHEDPLWACVYGWLVEHQRVGGAAWRARHRQRPRPPVRRRARGRRGCPPGPGCSTCPPATGSRCGASSRPGPRLRRRRHLRRRCSTAPWRRPRRLGVDGPGHAARRRRGRPAARRRLVRPGRVASPACTASPTRTARSPRWCACCAPAASSPGARCSTTPGAPTSRRAGSAPWAGSSARCAPPARR